MERPRELKKNFEERVKFDEDAPGSVYARIGAVGSPDKVGDVLVKGSVGRQKVGIAGFNHDRQGPPVGKGEIYEDGDSLFFKGQFFLDSTAGKDNYEAVKQLSTVEWSWGGIVKEIEQGEQDGEPVFFLKGVDFFEASPVWVAANYDTQTISVKSASEEPPSAPLLRRLDLGLGGLLNYNQAKRPESGEGVR